MTKKSKILISLLIIFLIGFIVLSVIILYYPILPIDIGITLAIQKYQSKWLDKVMQAISFFGEFPWSFLLLFVTASIFNFSNFKRESYFIMLILFSSLIISGVKNIVNRPRPTSFHVHLVEVYRFQSYPSGHVLSYILFFGFLIILMKSLPTITKGLKILITIISSFFIVMIAPSRIYLGAHWFTDTLGGFLLGSICLFILSYFYFKKSRRVN